MPASRVCGIQDLPPNYCEPLNVSLENRLNAAQQLDQECKQVSMQDLILGSCRKVSEVTSYLSEVGKLPMTNVLHNKLQEADLLSKVSVGAFVAIAESLTTPSQAEVWVHSINRFLTLNAKSEFGLCDMKSNFVANGYPMNSILMRLWKELKGYEPPQQYALKSTTHAIEAEALTDGIH